MLVFEIVYVTFQYLFIKIYSKLMIAQISIAPIVFDFGFGKYCFKIGVVSL